MRTATLRDTIYLPDGAKLAINCLVGCSTAINGMDIHSHASHEVCGRLANTAKSENTAYGAGEHPIGAELIKITRL